MEYKILESKVDGELVYTKVEYTLGEEVVVVDIPHFQPTSLKDIELGIKNRAVSEQRKLDAVKKNEELVLEMQDEKSLLSLNKRVEITK